MKQLIYLFLLTCVLTCVKSYDASIYAKDSSNNFVYKIEYDSYPYRYFVTNFAKKFLHSKCNLDMYKSINLNSYSENCGKDSFNTGSCSSTSFNIKTGLYINPSNVSCSNIHSFTDCIIDAMDSSICDGLELTDIFIFSLVSTFIIIVPILIICHLIKRRNIMYAY